MHRFFVPVGELEGEHLLLSSRESRHAVQVLRLRPGDAVLLLTGQGEECRGEVAESVEGRLRVRIVERVRHARAGYRLTLVQAVPKGKVMDTIVQKATELGVDRIIPLLTERTVPEYGAGGGSAKRERWMGIAVESIKQCGSPWLPEIAEPMPLERWIREGESSELRLVGSLQRGATHARQHIEAFVSERGRLPVSMEVWVGPEGDYTEGEMEKVVDLGVKPITMGPHVLRSDTAAVYALAVVRYEMAARE